MTDFSSGRDGHLLPPSAQFPFNNHGDSLPQTEDD